MKGLSLAEERLWVRHNSRWDAAGLLHIHGSSSQVLVAIFNSYICPPAWGRGRQRCLWGRSDSQSVKWGLAVAATLLPVLCWWGLIPPCPKDTLSSWVQDVAGFFHFAAHLHHTQHVPTGGFSTGDVPLFWGAGGAPRSASHAFPCACEWQLHCTWELSGILDIGFGASGCFAPSLCPACFLCVLSAKERQDL